MAAEVAVLAHYTIASGCETVYRLRFREEYEKHVGRAPAPTTGNGTARSHQCHGD